MIIDVHAHIFPEAIAKKASDNIGAFYDLPMEYKGTPELLVEEGDRAGVDKFVVHSVATTVKQVHNINSFIFDSVKKYPDRFIGFASLHPDDPNLEYEFNWALENGLKGIKLHPDFQKFKINSESAKRIYKLCEGKCPVLIHLGDIRTDYSKAEFLLPILDEFPNLDIMGSHLGGYTEWESGTAALAGTRVYMDCASSLPFLDLEKAKELVMKYDKTQLLFGTDYPMWDASNEIENVKKLELSEERYELLMHGNFECLMKKYE
ncbi:MAG: TatD family hydrolase [Oscillospiraceae bacterium]|nr:TatD family hydrolase [Oscillospiraceae bacterium]